MNSTEDDARLFNSFFSHTTCHQQTRTQFFEEMAKVVANVRFSSACNLITQRAAEFCARVFSQCGLGVPVFVLARAAGLLVSPDGTKMSVSRQSPSTAFIVDQSAPSPSIGTQRPGEFIT